MKRPAHIKDWAYDGPDEFYVATDYGWAFDPSPDQNAAGHIHIFQTMSEARRYVTKHNRPKPCNCLRCTSFGKARGV